MRRVKKLKEWTFVTLFVAFLCSCVFVFIPLLDFCFKATGHPGAGTAFAQENLTPPQIPAATEPEPPRAGISIPAELKVGEHVQAELTGISLDDVAKGRVTLEIYPKDSVTVFSNISFITRKPEIILFPKKTGEFWLVFVLHNERSYNYIDVPFTVKGAGE